MRSVLPLLARFALLSVIAGSALAGCKGRFKLPADARFVTQIALAGSFGCARMKDGSVRAWGANDAGQLGDGTTEARAESVRAGGAPLVFTKVAAGEAHACAIATGGDVYCWGSNDAGELGDGTKTAHPAPVRAGVYVAKDIALGDHHTCALTPGGEVACWGATDGGGKSGDGGGDAAKAALGPRVPGMQGATALAAGGDATCALLRDRTVSCWGKVPGRGVLPVTRIDGLSDVVSIAVSATHACAVRAFGGIACWGNDEEGELGDGDFAPRAAPVDVQGLTVPAVSVAVGRAHSCALLRNATVYCWGANGSAQLSDGTSAHRSSAALVNGLFEVQELAAAGDATCARFADGSDRCWGGLRLPKTEGAVLAVPTEVRW